MKRLVASLLVILWLPPIAMSAPPDAKFIPADSQWLVHFDFEVMKSSTLGTKVRDEILKQQKAVRDLQQLRDLVGLDLLEDVHSATFHGNQFVPGRGAVVLYADLDYARIVPQLRARFKYEASSYDGHTLHSCTALAGDRKTTIGCFAKPGVFVFGQHLDDLKKALDVVDGKRPCLAVDSLLLSGVPSGTFFQAKATGLDKIEKTAPGGKNPFNSPIVQHVELLCVAGGEEGDQVFANIRVMTKDAESAQQMGRIARGFQALALMDKKLDDEKRKMLRSITITTEDRTVTIEIRGGVEDVLELIEKQSKKL